MLRPIARGITYLEGSHLFAYYLTTLLKTRNELNRLADANLKHTKPLLKVVKEGFELRFKDIMNINSPTSVPLYLSMLTHPGFKINFIPELRNSSLAIEYITKCKGMLLKAIEAIDVEEELLSNKNLSPPEAITNQSAENVQSPHDGGLYFFHFSDKLRDDSFEMRD